MKNIVKILAFVSIASAFSACNSDAKMQAYKNSKRIQDSLRLDSFKRAEIVTKEKAEIKAANISASRNTRNTVQPVVIQTEEQKRKGMSSAAKGAIIGAGAGAVTGILVDKKDGRGAIIGGVVGAGTGYVIGRDKDKKSGRVQK